MAMKQGLSAKQTQHLAMTPELRDAIALLQMTRQEIIRFVTEEMESNPLLELELDPGAADAVVPTSGEALASGTGSSGGDAMEFSDRVANLRQRPSLWEHLSTQIALSLAPAPQRALATMLIHELDADGYLRTPLNEIADRAGANVATIEASLAVLQACEPTGIGARNLGECLSLQLNESGPMPVGMSDLLDNIDQFQTAAFDKMRRTVTEKGGDFDALLAQLRLLNPTPAAAFETGVMHYAVPDVIVARNNLGGWSVDLNPAALPRVIMNNTYAAETTTNGEVAKFVRDCVSRGSWLIKSLDQRAQSILKVATEIVRVQDNFFSAGIAYLKPLTLRDVADAVGLHESTVSRVTKDKYLSCSRGNFEMKFFFSQSIQVDGGTGATSSVAVRARIRELVDQESAQSVLSDDKIVKILGKDGIKIARRTVSKYREAMQIPSSVERRRFKASSEKIRP